MELSLFHVRYSAIPIVLVLLVWPFLGQTVSQHMSCFFFSYLLFHFNHLLLYCFQSQRCKNSDENVYSEGICYSQSFDHCIYPLSIFSYGLHTKGGFFDKEF